MGVFSGPEIATSGLIFSFDQSNTDKSWKGKPTTNFYTNGHFSGGNGVTQESGSNATNEVIVFKNPGNSDYVLRQTGTVAFTEYQINLTTQLAASTTYVLSGWYAESPDYSCADGSRMFHSRAYSTSGANVALGIGIGTVLETRIVNGITWKYCYATITTPADYNNVFEWYLGYGGSAYTGYRYYTNLQMEVGTFPSRFVDGTRSNTQALLDLTNRNTITANSLSYASNNSFSFNGTNNSITVGQTLNYIPALSNFTLETWLRVPAYPTAAANNAYGQTDRAGVLFGAAYYSGAALYWNGNSAGTALNIFAFIRGQDAYRQTSSKSISLNTWTHLVMVNNYTASLIQFYVDGVLFHETTGPSQQYDSSLVPTAGNIGLCKAQIDGGGTSNYSNLNCEVPIARIYKDKALSAAEVRQNFNALRGRFGI